MAEAMERLSQAVQEALVLKMVYDTYMLQLHLAIELERR
jgi:hypothetical protein